MSYPMASSTRLLVILVTLCFITGVSFSLICHSCINTNTNKECNKYSVTCAAGSICYTTVRRVPIFEKLYTKGCIESGMCYGLQNLNDADVCQQEGSVCTYCCSSQYCNAYNAAPNIYGTLTYLSMLFIMLTMSLL